MNSIIKDNVKYIGVALAMLGILVIPMVFAQASELEISDYGYTSYYEDYGGDYSDYGYTSYYDDYGGDYSDYAYTSYYDDSYQDSYGQQSYSNPSYSTPSYSYPSYKSGSYYIPPQYYYPPQKPSTPSQHCVNNSCNTEVINNTNVNTNVIGSFNAQPYISYQQDYDVCYNLPGMQATAPQGYYTHAGNCVMASYNQYPAAPYVSLSAVPYTGLELGPVGTALYWGFLLFWCLLAAYLVAVKKVQNKLVASINGFLFPSTPVTAASHSAATHAPSSTYVAPAAAVRTGDAIDPFIQGQINRSR